MVVRDYLTTQTLSLRMPLKSHRAVKKRAVVADTTMSEYYVGLIDRFVGERLSSNVLILAAPIDAATISIVVATTQLQRWRDMAEEHACTVQGIALTAVDEELYGRLVRLP